MLFRYIYLVTTAVIFKFAVMKSLYPGAISPVWAWKSATAMSHELNHCLAAVGYACC